MGLVPYSSPQLEQGVFLVAWLGFFVLFGGFFLFFVCVFYQDSEVNVARMTLQISFT